MVWANADESQRRLRELADRERRARRRPRRDPPASGWRRSRPKQTS